MERRRKGEGMLSGSQKRHFKTEALYRMFLTGQKHTCVEFSGLGGTLTNVGGGLTAGGGWERDKRSSRQGDRREVPL